MARIKSVHLRDDTTLRLGGVGDNWHMSWASDDRQYASLCDGFAWSKAPTGFYNSRLLAIEGVPGQTTFAEVPGYPDLAPSPWGGLARYYNFGTLALDGKIYQFLSILNHGYVHSDGTSWPGMRFVGAKLIYSPDNGRTWRNQNGSAPVVWEGWDQHSRDSLVFFREDQEAFSLLSVLQMGRNYEHNRDGFIYVYAPNGNIDGTMNELVMFRVPKAQFLDRTKYEYFAGIRSNGDASWTQDIASRAAVHTFPRGWVNIDSHPWAWLPSVVYNAPLGLYMMTSWGTGTVADGKWFAKPSYLGFWIAPQPWGPWKQIHEELAWTPEGDSVARVYSPQIAPKWIAPDGKSFWLVWSDYQFKDKEAYDAIAKVIKQKGLQGELTDDDWARWAAAIRRHMPYYGFNAQRVDLTVE